MFPFSLSFEDAKTPGYSKSSTPLNTRAMKIGRFIPGPTDEEIKARQKPKPRLVFSTLPHHPVFDPEDAAFLRQEGTLIDGSAPGLVKVHKRRINRASAEEYQDIPFPPQPANTTSNVDLDHFEEIPDHVYSYETLLYVGFSQERATELWEHWNSVNDYDDEDYSEGWRDIDGGMVTFEEICIARFDFKDDGDTVSEDDTEWRKSMDSIGISQDLQNAIMTPSCRGIRLTASCFHWLNDTMVAAFAHLWDVQNTSERRKTATEEATTHGGSASAISQSSPVLNRSQGQSTSQVDTVSSPALSGCALGSTVLFCGGFTTNRFLDRWGRDDGNFTAHFGTFQDRSTDNGEFNMRWGGAVYLYPDLAVARKYAFWARKRGMGRINASVLRVEIPNTAIESLDKTTDLLTTFWPDDEWKQLVYGYSNSKRYYSLRKTPLVKFTKATLVIGTIHGRPNEVVATLGSADDITEDFLNPEFDGCSQYVFMDYQGSEYRELEFLEEHGKGWRLFPYTCDNEEEERLGADYIHWKFRLDYS